MGGSRGPYDENASDSSLDSTRAGRRRWQSENQQKALNCLKKRGCGGWVSLQEGAWVLWGLGVGMWGPAASFGHEWGWELGFAFPPGDGAGSGQTPGALCASLAPPMLHLLWETSLMGTDSIGHPATGPDPPLQLCSGCVFSLNPNIFVAQTPRNGAFLPQRARTSSAAGE